VVENSPVKDRVELLPETNIPPFDLGLCCFKKKLNDPLIAEFMSMAGQAQISS